MIRFLTFIIFPFLLLLGLDYYVQNISSPVKYQASESIVSLNNQNSKLKKNGKPNKEKRTEKPKASTQTETPIALSCFSISSEIKFLDYDKKKQKVSFEVCDSILRNSVKQREILKTRNAQREYAKFDSKNIEPIVDSYRRQIRKLKLNKKEAAEYVVASIQNLPYTLVHQYSHKAAENPQTYIKIGATALQAKKYAMKIKNMHKEMTVSPLEQPGGCLQGVDYGMVTPVEMFINKMGDCDSRCTALFLVLKKLGYDVIELGSDLYQHAVLGLNLPGANSGNIYYIYKGRKYYIWETTLFHPEQTRLGVHRNGAKYMSNWAAWEVALK